MLAGGRSIEGEHPLSTKQQRIAKARIYRPAEQTFSKKWTTKRHPLRKFNSTKTWAALPNNDDLEGVVSNMSSERIRRN